MGHFGAGLKTLRHQKRGMRHFVPRQCAKKVYKQESCAIAKMTAQCTLYTGALKIFSSSSRPSPGPDPNHYRNRICVCHKGRL